GLAALGGQGKGATASPDAAPPPVAPMPSAPPVSVDVHCHTFCSADLPIVGFVAHFIPGLTELSRLVSRWPEVVVRALVGAVAKLPDAAAPAGDVELARLGELVAHLGPPVAPVPPLPSELLDLLLDKLGKHLPFTVSAEKRRIIGRYLTTLYLVAHPRSAIAASITDLFPSVSLFTPALVDYDAWSEDRAPTPLWQQILVQEQIARLATLGQIGRAAGAPVRRRHRPRSRPVRCRGGRLPGREALPAGRLRSRRQRPPAQRSSVRRPPRRRAGVALCVRGRHRGAPLDPRQLGQRVRPGAAPARLTRELGTGAR